MKVKFLRRPRAEEVGPGDTFDVGEIHDLPRASVERWLRRGAVEVCATTPAAPEPDRDAQIRAAVASLDPTDPALWTKAGIPDVRALEAVLGFDITAAERDAAWAAVSEAE